MTSSPRWIILACITLGWVIIPVFSNSPSYHWERVNDEPSVYELPTEVGIPFQNDEIVKRNRITLNGAAVAKCVRNTNSYRKRHENTPDLVWDPKLA